MEVIENQEKEFNSKFDAWLDSEYDKHCEAEFDKYCQQLEQEQTKKLTQAVFENAPDWAKSAAVDENGIANFFSCYKSILVAGQTSIGGMWLFVEGWGGRFEQIGTGYDTTDWQHSAIDRE